MISSRQPKTFRIAILTILLALTGLSAESKRHPSVPKNEKKSEALIKLTANPSSLTAVFEHLAKNTIVARSVTMTELGVGSSLVMGGVKTQSSIYWPVPADVPLQDAEITFNAVYERADQGRTTLLLSIDGTPALARGVALERGNADLVVAVPRVAQSFGYVHLGIDWNTVIAAKETDSSCTDMRSMGNYLRVMPTSRLTYRFDSAQITNVSSAWTSLPPAPVVLVSNNKLSADAFESAWRIGLTMERSGKRPKVVTLPQAGHEVDTHLVFVPDVLKKIPSFAALARGDRHVLSHAAEAGAWFVLSQLGEAHADVVIADRAMVSALSANLDALGTQIKEYLPETFESFVQLRHQRLDGLTAQTATGNFRLVQSLGGVTLVVAPDAGGKFAGLLGTQWRSASTSSDLLVSTANLPLPDTNKVLLKSLQGGNSNLRATDNGEWASQFQIDADIFNGKFPSELVMDFSASPSSRGVTPVVSVFLNDVLLASKRLKANGERERVTATIPDYSLGLGNVVKVVLMRPPEGANCRESQVVFPFSVLPSSHLVLDAESSNTDFRGMASRLTQGGDVLVPSAYLTDAQRSLSRLIRISAAAGVSPAKAKLVTVTKDQKGEPHSSFLALDVGLVVNAPTSLVDKGHLVIKDEKDQKLLDIAGLTCIGIASIERVNDVRGIVYQTVADDLEHYDIPFRLKNGNFAIIRREGQVTEFDTLGNLDRQILEHVNDSRLMRYIGWILVGVLIVGFVVLLYAANRYRGRKSG